MRSAVRPNAVSAAPQSSAGWGPYAGEQHFTTPSTTVSWSRRGISMPFDPSGAEDPWMNAVRPDAVSAAPQSSAGWGPYAGEQHFTTPSMTVSWSRRGISMPFDASGGEDPWMNAEVLDPSCCQNDGIYFVFNNAH